MGEYATYKGEQIKIGTCEDMYYLRADQARLVSAKRQGETDVIGCASAIRFRFPFPDEDGIEPGSFDNYGRAVAVHGVTVPQGVEHYSVQFVAQAGYLVSLPCPEGDPNVKQGLETAVGDLRVHRNGFRGSVLISQQRVWNGYLATVCECGGCGAKWRLETLEDARPIIEACRAVAREYSEGVLSHRDESRARWWNALADRIEGGYTSPLPWN